MMEKFKLERIKDSITNNKKKKKKMKTLQNYHILKLLFHLSLLNPINL